jgi:hypothetical protein
MNEKPSILVLLLSLSEYAYFILLTMVIRATFTPMKWSLRYLDWAYDSHVERQVIAFRLVNILKQITPESVKAVNLWQLR